MSTAPFSMDIVLASPAIVAENPSPRPQARSRRRRKVSQQRQAQLDQDARLVERARGGDQAAFRQLVQRYQERAVAVALGIMRNRDDAQDVVQDAFIKAYRSLDRFEGQSSFYTWLYRIIVNLCIDLKRKHARSRTDPLDEGHAGREDDAAGSDVSPWRPGSHPLKNTEDRELAAQIHAALGRLTEAHRTILVLREVDGLSYEELATTLNISKGTVMSRLFHARHNMQRLLKMEVNVPAGLGGADAGRTDPPK